MNTPHPPQFQFPFDPLAVGDVWRLKSAAIEIRIRGIEGIAVMYSRINGEGKTEDEVLPMYPSDLRRFYFRTPYQGTSV